MAGKAIQIAWKRFRAEFLLIALFVAMAGLISFQHQLLGRDIVVQAGGDLTPFGFSGYDDRFGGGHSTFTLNPKKPLDWSCTLRAGSGPPYCGYEIGLDDFGARAGQDLRNFERIELVFDYRGPPTTLRFHLKNEDPRYSKHNDRSTAKLNKAEFTIVPGLNRVVLEPPNFGVAEWWIQSRKLPPELGRVQLDNIISFEFVTGWPSPLAHSEFSIRTVRVVRPGIVPEKLYLGVMAVLALATIFYVTVRTRRARDEALARAELEEQARQAVEQAKLSAERASEAKSAYLANMSHELRTPLNAVLGYAQLLQRMPLASKEMNAVRIIHKSGTHLLNLISDVLDLGKIEAGKMELTLAPCDLPACLHAVAEMIRVKAEEKDLAFSVEIGEGVPASVLADEKRLRQVLLNLLGNAVKFTPDGGVSLIVSLLQRDERAARLRFEIRDTGAGIAADELEQIFQPFERAGNAAGSEGSGLGLSITRQLVGLMDSRIDVRSAPGQGSSFWFDVCFALAQELGSPQPASCDEIFGYVGRRRRILIVDDAKSNRDLLDTMLSELGFDCTQAADGREAVALAQNINPDVILMDVRMPGMGGPETVRFMRRIETLKHVPILTISADIAEDSGKTALAAGADGFLSKPVDRSDLLLALSKLCGLEWTTAPAEKPTQGAFGAARRV